MPADDGPAGFQPKPCAGLRALHHLEHARRGHGTAIPAARHAATAGGGRHCT
jgi:hypothetical protein